MIVIDFEKMKKGIGLFIAIILSVLYLSQGSLAYAQVSDCPAQFASLCNSAIVTSGPGVIVAFIIVITIVVCLFFLIFGGIRWVTSGGDKGKIAAARSTLIAAIVGLVIACFSFLILNIILGFFTGHGITGMQLPKLYNP